jgi:hypothetical protein
VLQGRLAVADPVEIMQAATQEEIEREAMRPQPLAAVGPLHCLAREYERAGEVASRVGHQRQVR